MRLSIRLSAVLFLIVCVASLAGCGNGSAKFITPPPTPQYLYVANDSNPGSIAQYTLPLTSTSTPNFTLPVNDVDGLVLDSSGNLIAIGYAGAVEVYDAPLSASSTPSVTFSSPPASIGIALDSSGDLFVGSNASPGFYVSEHPLTSSSTFSTPNANGIQFVNGAAVDSSGNLIVCIYNNTPSVTGSLAVFAPPYTGSPAVVTPPISAASYVQPAINGTQLFVPNWASSHIDVYDLPLSSTSAPVFSITNTVNPTVVAFDKSGNLYVGGNQGELTVFAPPFSATSSPTLTLTLTSGGNPWSLWGMTVTY